MIVGPHVQLESTTFRRTPPQDKKHTGVLGYHRDMFAQFPENGVYHRAMLFNALAYLQDLNDENGPLRIIPGSHMKAIRIEPKERAKHHKGEVVLYPKAGDVAIFHCSMLHTGSYNFSDEYRYLYFMTLNHSWLKHRENFNGSVCQNIKAKARENKDRRLLRLLGEDDFFVQRANCGFQVPDENVWKQWIESDREELLETNMITNR
jgi:ectoine hydroxylase-related dioxygenase (phytanoyl-CoA dioxygenase family)